MALQPVIVVLVHTDDCHPKPSLCHRRRLESRPTGLTTAAPAALCWTSPCPSAGEQYRGRWARLVGFGENKILSLFRVESFSF